jgi:ABC-type polysaccharide/polyol phosphate export permease
MLHLTRTLIDYREAAGVLSRVSLKTTVATTRLGWLWWIFDPLVMMGIYYFMVKIVFDRGGEGYHLFALTGIVSWQFFAKTIQLTATTLHRNKQLLTHTMVPLEVFTVVPVLIQTFFALIGYGIIVAWNAQGVTSNVLYLFPVLFVMGLFALALGAIMSICVVFLPDASKFIDYGLRAGFFITPILYPASRIAESGRIPELMKDILALNPMMWAITQLRNVILYRTPLDLGSFALWLAAGVIALQLAMVVLRMNRQNVMKHL